MWCFVYDFIASQASLLRVLEEPDLENILLESLGGDPGYDDRAQI